MELILISESKLKVMLTADDMRQYHLDCDTMDSDTAATRRAFWNILDEAREQTGFDPGGEKVFVQLYPDKGGGCEMFVTKIGGAVNSKEKHAQKKSTPPSQNNPLCRESAYSFDCLSHLLMACRRLRGSASGTTRAYASRDNRLYYLLFTGECPDLSEYGGNRCRPREIPYILEHGRCFCEDAVGMLADLA